MTIEWAQQDHWPKLAQLSAILLALAAGIFLFIEVPDVPVPINQFWDLGHVLLFGLLTWLWLRSRRPSWITPKRAFLLIGSAAVLALLTELGQLLAARDFEIRDIVYDMAGVGLVLLYQSQVNRRWRVVSILIIILLLLAPILRSLFAYGIALRQWPVLVDGDQWAASVWMETDTRVERVPAVGHLLWFRQLKYSGFFVTAVKADWHEYNSLHFVVTNPNDVSLTLHCHISDRLYKPNSGDFADRYNTKIELPPGPTSLRIALDVVKFGPVSRQLELHRMRGFGCFLENAKADTSLLVHRVMLE